MTIIPSFKFTLGRSFEVEAYASTRHFNLWLRAPFIGEVFARPGEWVRSTPTEIRALEQRRGEAALDPMIAL
ncbi:MAG: hypothetical protein DI601_03815 [Azospirillum brasilense]|nr:MAG: hypothetical protein DI601_03815 [Azospirillum brasilense]